MSELPGRSCLNQADSRISEPAGLGEGRKDGKGVVVGCVPLSSKAAGHTLHISSPAPVESFACMHFACTPHSLREMIPAVDGIIYWREKMTYVRSELWSFGIVIDGTRLTRSSTPLW